MTDQGNRNDAWREQQLSSLLVSMESGSRPKGGVRGIDDGVPSLGGEHLNALGGLNVDNLRYVPTAFYDSMKRGHIQPGDILIVKDGATTGKVSLVRDDFPYKRAVANEHLFVCRPDKVDPEYLFWYLYSGEGQRRILEHFKGSAQGGITREFADATLVPVAPTVHEQKQLARMLGAAFAARLRADDHLATARRAMMAFRQAVLTAACSGRLTADWRGGNTPSETANDLLASVEAARRKRLGRRFKPQPARVVDGQPPEGWISTTVGALVDVATGATPLRKRADYYGGAVPWVTSGAVNVGLITEATEFITELAIRETNAKVFPAGTLLVAMYGEGQTRGRVAELGIPAATNQAVAALLFDADTEPLRDYLRIFFLENYERLRRLSFGGVQPNLSLGVIRETPIPLPPLEEQVEIVRRVQRLSRLANGLHSRVEAAAKGLDRSSQAILAKAFRGELAVS